MLYTVIYDGGGEGRIDDGVCVFEKSEAVFDWV